MAFAVALQGFGTTVPAALSGATKVFEMRKPPVQNPELAQLDATLQTLIRRAYDLGRTDALKKVVDVLNHESPGGDYLALSAPAETEAPQAAPPEPVNGKPAAAPPRPWWARSGR
jgi:ferritin-like metal-binding protein YciE